MAETNNPLSYLDREELIRYVEDLQEQLRMSQAFGEVSDLPPDYVPEGVRVESKWA